MKTEEEQALGSKAGFPYLELIEASTDGVIVVDYNGRILFSNKKAKELLMHETDDILGQEIGLPLVKDDVSELELPRKDGSSRIVEMLTVELVWKSKNAYLCNLRDITEKKIAENELRYQEELLEQTGKMAKVGGWEFIPGGETVYWTKVTKEIHEVPEDYCATYDEALSFFPGESGELLKRAINSAITQGKPFELTLELITAAGNHRWVHTKATPEIYKSKCIRLAGVFQDITRQKEAELALQRNEERFRVALSDSSIIVWQQDLDLRYTWIYNVNEAFKQEEVIGKKDEELLNKPEEIETLTSIKKQVIQTGQSTSEVVKTTLNNQPFFYKLTVEPLYDIDQKIIGVTCVSIDITDLKLTERKLEKAVKKAQESDKLKSAFLANMSHEIRTPMNGIMGFADLLKKPDLSGERQQEFIKIIHDSGKRMLNIIDELVDIAKIESGQVELHKKEMLINELIDNVHKFFSNEANSKGIELKTNKGLYDTDCLVCTDKNKLNQILGNLVKNAIKYTDKGFIEIGYTKEGNYIRFYVKDTGTGISEDQRDKIFERFRQADMSIHRDYEGAGLGLSISKAYVELLGGEIWMTSKMNEGSTFYFTIPYELPVRKEEKLIDLVDGPAKEDINDLTLLVAEDDEASYHLIKEMMEDTDVKLIRAENGKEAIEKTENNQLIDLVLMDIKMPVLDGYQATKLIKKQFPNLPIIAQTAFASKKDKQKALKEGCDDYIAKPIREDELIAILLKYQKPKKPDVS